MVYENKKTQSHDTQDQAASASRAGQSFSAPSSIIFAASCAAAGYPPSRSDRCSLRSDQRIIDQSGSPSKPQPDPASQPTGSLLRYLDIQYSVLHLIRPLLQLEQRRTYVLISQSDLKLYALLDDECMLACNTHVSTFKCIAYS